MNKQEYYRQIAIKKHPASTLLTGDIYDVQDRRAFEMTAYISGLQKGEQLAKEFAEWASLRGWENVGKSYWFKVPNLSRSTDKLFNDFITEKTKQ